MTDTVDNGVAPAAPPALMPEFSTEQTWARIDGGKVVEISTSDWDLSKHTHPSIVWINATGATSAAVVGGLYADGVFAPAPVTAPVPVTRFSIDDFMSKLTPEEDTKITAASTTDGRIMVWLLSLASREYVDVTDARTKQGVGYMLSKGLITPERAEAILAPGTPA